MENRNRDRWGGKWKVGNERWEMKGGRRQLETVWESREEFGELDEVIEREARIRKIKMNLKINCYLSWIVRRRGLGNYVRWIKIRNWQNRKWLIMKYCFYIGSMQKWRKWLYIKSRSGPYYGGGWAGGDVMDFFYVSSIWTGKSGWVWNTAFTLTAFGKPQVRRSDRIWNNVFMM